MNLPDDFAAEERRVRLAIQQAQQTVENWRAEQAWSDSQVRHEDVAEYDGEDFRR